MTKKQQKIELLVTFGVRQTDDGKWQAIKLITVGDQLEIKDVGESRAYFQHAYDIAVDALQRHGLKEPHGDKE